MTATNHAVTGATIGLLVGNPWVALPAALLSHFVCDGLPHYGVKDSLTTGLPLLSKILLIDATLCGGIVLALALAQPPHWLLASFCAFGATAPDFMWLKGYVRARRHQPRQALRWRVMRLHAAIQWFERPSGAWVEVAWCLGVGTIFVTLLRG
ncbi:MAG: hypothetical protein ABI602_03470 [Candidatus Saccharibacteria bacterium]